MTEPNDAVINTSSDASHPMKTAFLEWLSSGNTKKHSQKLTVSCIEKISKYAIEKKISSTSLWNYTKQDMFKPIYRKLLDTKLLRISDKHTYEMFIIAGQLYLKFLKEQPLISKAGSSDAVGQTHNRTIAPISPDDIIAWLITQPNSNGTLYLETVVRQYMYSIQSAPLKLELSIAPEQRNVFLCKTDEELLGLWEVFKNAPNYKKVNSISSGMFSAGMSCFLRYIKHISDTHNRQAVRFADSEYPTADGLSKTISDAKIIERLTTVLTAHFANGYRINSPIEILRFRAFVEEDLGENFEGSDDELKSYIASCGTMYEDKVYVVSTGAKGRIKELVEDYFADGAKVIFFAEFFVRNESWLFESNIVSADMLIIILKKLFSKLSFTQTYFGYMDFAIPLVLVNEILRVWGSDTVLTYEQLANRLQYIPLDRIKSVLRQNGDFIWNSVRTFSHVDRIEITNEERDAIRAAAVLACSDHGYVSVADLPLGEIEGRNYELSVTAVHNAIYRICLSTGFDKKGKIIMCKGTGFNALTIMQEYCRTIDKCVLSDLLKFERELTGEVHRWIPMEAGNTILVRTDKENYVADNHVHFNRDLIDEIICLFVKDDYFPLKAFTTFSAFPDCGQAWNLFLLESYCRRFSYKFRFDAPSVNSRNVGAIIRKSCNLNYTEIMSDAVANADVTLNNVAIGQFLCASGYTSRSTTVKADEIINRAKTIRERRG